MNLDSDDVEVDGELPTRNLHVTARKRNDCVPFKDQSDVLDKSRQNRGLKVTTEHAYSNQNEIYDSGIHSDFIPSQSSDEVHSAETLKSLKSLTLSDEPKFEAVDDGIGSLRLSKSPDPPRDPEADKAESESIQQYLAFVEDTFNQDEDGDTRLHKFIIFLLSEPSINIIDWAPNTHVLNIKNDHGQTALHLAVITRQAAVARRLMTAGAQVDPRDCRGNTPLHIACKLGYDDIASYLLQPIQHSEIARNIEPIAYQKIPQDLDVRNYDGQTFVHVAVEEGHVHVLDLLLRNEADINARDGKSGRTVLHYAAESGNMSLLAFLIACRGIDVNALTYSRQTPVMLAKGRGHSDVVRILRDAGALYEESGESEEESMDDEPVDYKFNGNPV
ncbi:NF-kappa-B inhibitor alpha-like [Dreissena polymorpha]|uniref:Uncharacterized protein n=1 Tax=Dreissena polymorpha TaxID=45954 RepID=A0A9D4QZ33_DREPO|nr:NF-kappa-B inhibitor alpha-like [Dreissena polymorpha]KAH3848173.1 hypothetical protein DPMN_090530 [Dreissena polymorpha]